MQTNESKPSQPGVTKLWAQPTILNRLVKHPRDAALPQQQTAEVSHAAWGRVFPLLFDDDLLYFYVYNAS